MRVNQDKLLKYQIFYIIAIILCSHIGAALIKTFFNFLWETFKKCTFYITNRLNEFIIFTIWLFQTVFIDFFCVSIRNHFFYFEVSILKQLRKFLCVRMQLYSSGEIGWYLVINNEVRKTYWGSYLICMYLGVSIIR